MEDWEPAAHAERGRDGNPPPKTARTKVLLYWPDMMKIMKTIGYLFVFAAGILVGVAGAKWLVQRQIEGITLDQDITIYNENSLVAELKAGSRFNRQKNTRRCSFEFYLDQHQPKTHEIVEPYYSDKKH